MNVYRIYMIDEAGHIAGPPEVLEDVDDERAVKIARERVDGLAVELWKGAERLKRFEPE